MAHSPYLTSINRASQIQSIRQQRSLGLAATGLCCDDI